jgi:hypothetical protein
VSGASRDADVARQLDVHAAGATGHDGAEQGIGRCADEQLDAVGCHRLHEEAVELGPVRGQALAHRVGGAAHGGGRAQVERDAADVALVQQPRRDRLQRYRRGQLGCGSCRCGWRGRGARGCEWKAVAVEQRCTSRGCSHVAPVSSVVPRRAARSVRGLRW